MFVFPFLSAFLISASPTIPVLQPLIAIPPHYSPFTSPSISYPFVSPLSFICCSRVVLKSGVRTAVAALDREIQHLYEYRMNRSFIGAAIPTIGRPIVCQHCQEIMESHHQPFVRSIQSSLQHSSSSSLIICIRIRFLSIFSTAFPSPSILLSPKSLF